MSYLYIHIPFCSSICHYCDFKRSIYNEQQVNQYLKVLVNDFNSITKDELKTVYIGGGTPSCLNEKQLQFLLKSLKPYLKNVMEYTIESNIESLCKNKVRILLDNKVNRISLGVQSLQDKLLKIMNRKHSKEDVLSTIEHLYQWGMKNISVDLIYGLPFQTLEMWKEDLEILCSNPYINHISLYSLTIEKNTVFDKLNYALCANELEADMYEMAIHICSKHGFHQYEIANFAKTNYESQHNQAYWRYENFYGLGLGASGKTDDYRYTNTGSIHAYCECKHLVEKEYLNKQDKMFEHIMMSLRMRKGLDIKRFEALYHIDFYKHYKNTLDKYAKNSQLYIKDDFLCVSEKAMFYLHDILVDFME